MKINRREFCILTGITILNDIIPGCREKTPDTPTLPQKMAAKQSPEITIFSKETATSPEKSPRVFDVFGLHGVPKWGGAKDISSAIRDYKQLRIKGVHEMDPDLRLIEELKRAGINLSVRVNQEKNKFDPSHLHKTLTKLEKAGVKPIVQFINEPNLPEKENGGGKIEPEDLIYDFIKGCDIIKKYGGISLLPPLAQSAPVDEYNYYERMIKELKKYKTDAWIKENLGLCFHMYLETPNENPWKRIERLEKIAFDNFEIHLPVYITEASLLIDKEHQYKDNEMAMSQTITNLLKMTVPKDINLKAVNCWLYANFVQRLSDDEKDESAREHEIYAWVKRYGKAPVFDAVVKLVQENLSKAA